MIQAAKIPTFQLKIRPVPGNKTKDTLKCQIKRKVWLPCQAEQRDRLQQSHKAPQYYSCSLTGLLNTRPGPQIQWGRFLYVRLKGVLCFPALIMDCQQWSKQEYPDDPCNCVNSSLKSREGLYRRAVIVGSELRTAVIGCWLLLLAFIGVRLVVLQQFTNDSNGPS